MKFLKLIFFTMFCLFINRNFAYGNEHDNCELAKKNLLDSEYLTYEMFDAKGDGVSDDGKAIKTAHEEGNVHKLDIDLSKSGSKKKYYVKETRGINIETNVNFNEAIIEIDEQFNRDESPLFEISSSGREEKIGEKKVLEEVLDILKNKEKSKYISKYNNKVITAINSQKIIANREIDGKLTKIPYKEIFAIADKQIVGNIYLDPISYDIENLTNVTLNNIDKSTLTFQNLNIILLGNKKSTSKKPEKTISIFRSNVNFSNVNVKFKDLSIIDNEKQREFLFIEETYNVNIKSFKGPNFKALEDKKKLVYSYLLMAMETINLTIDDFETKVNEKDVWGAMGTNFCKNMTMKNSKTTRFDSHFYGADLTIEDSWLGSSGFAIAVHGFGDLKIKNVIGESYIFLNLRPDYGSSWNGNIFIEDSTLNFTGNEELGEAYIIRQRNSFDVDYKYQTKLADNISIKNFKIIDRKNNYYNLKKSYVIKLDNEKGITGDVKNGEKNIKNVMLPEKINLENIKIYKNGEESPNIPLNIINVKGKYIEQGLSEINLKKIAGNEKIILNSNGYKPSINTHEGVLTLEFSENGLLFNVNKKSENSIEKKSFIKKVFEKINTMLNYRN